ncbi:cytochrome P450 [Micromonospora sp. NPDC000207]|uniref:TDP-4-keto-6-deoxyglucose 3,4-isomerase n=1 Tax=Micromonospora megalomicea subsp. nigra TaxID=136926 RepID=Q9F827_MICMH|nr:TDP-4-keto-6-deoxyglucose 3,4-isomerase [Micromonospora megalomicea subsp. nigra]
MNTTDRAVLGRRLQMIRGLYWGYGSNGDPYPMLLCGHDDDPHRWYRGLGGSGVRRSRTETWVVTDHATAVRVLDDPTFTRATGRTPEWMRAAGAPASTWAQPFRDVHAASWDAELPDPQEVEDRLTGLLPAPGTRLDLVRDLAWPMASRGVGADDPDVLRAAWDARVGLDAQLTPQPLAVTEAAIAAVPGDPHRRALFTAVEMTATAFVDAVLAVTATAGAAQRLADDPDVAARLVAEVLRLHPTAHLERRTAGTETVVGEHTVAAGDEVVVVVAAANRDAGVFADPDRLDPDRADADRALSAQRGHPGRLEELVVVLTTAALRSVAKALPGLTAGGPVVRRRRSPVLRATAHCPVEL